MTRLAFGAKCGRPGSPPASRADGRERSPSEQRRRARPTPMPRAVRPKNWRRVQSRVPIESCVHSLVIVSSRFRIMLATVVYAASSRGVEPRVARRFADVEQLAPLAVSFAK